VCRIRIAIAVGEDVGAARTPKWWRVARGRRILTMVDEGRERREV